MKSLKIPANVLMLLWPSKSRISVNSLKLQSMRLERDVLLDVYLPAEYSQNRQKVYPLILFNDGQDLPRMKFQEILESEIRRKKIPPVVVVGIHASGQRVREYGTARQADYKGRGDKAGHYTRFILEELLPYLYRHYRLSELAEDRTIAGFSLGGLSALDIAWANSKTFGIAGVFSGALWWRWAPVDDRDPDACRIMHDIVKSTPYGDQNQFFWFQAGTLDEEEDRNNNGVIDAIDDTRDLIAEILKKGYKSGAVRYLEIENGRHEPQTWGEAMPDFLQWALTDISAYGASG